MAESIYNLVPRAEVVKEKAPLYRSKHNPKKPVTGSTFCTKGTTRIIGAGGNYFTHKEKAPSVAQGGAIVVSKPSQQASKFRKQCIRLIIVQLSKEPCTTYEPCAKSMKAPTLVKIYSTATNLNEFLGRMWYSETHSCQV